MSFELWFWYFKEEDLFWGIGESKSPGVVDEEDVGFLLHQNKILGLGGKQEAPLSTILADLEVVTAVECLRWKFLEQLMVQRIWYSTRRK